MFKYFFCCHIYCAHPWPRLAAIGTASCAVSNRVSWYPRWRVLGLPIGDCTRGCNNCDHTRPQMSAIDVTKKKLFARLYLVPGMGTCGPWVIWPYLPTTPTVHYTTISGFPCKFFSQMAPHFFGHHDAPSNLGPGTLEGFEGGRLDKKN